jgi:hypothetical protein
VALSDLAVSATRYDDNTFKLYAARTNFRLSTLVDLSWVCTAPVALVTAHE